MTWSTRTADDTVAGDGIKTLGQDLWDRDAIAASSGWTWNVIIRNFSADTTWATQATGFFRMPVWAEEAAVITVGFLAKQSGGSNDADFRLRGRVYGGSFSTGASTSDALTGSYAPYQVTLAVPASPSWAGEVCEFTLDAQHLTGGGTWNLHMTQVMSNMNVVPI